MGNLYFQYREGFPDNLNKVFIETETKNQITYADLEKHSAEIGRASCRERV